MDDKIANILIYLFYALTLLTVVLYFVCESKTPFYYAGAGALIARGIHYVMKYLL